MPRLLQLFLLFPVRLLRFNCLVRRDGFALCGPIDGPAACNCDEENNLWKEWKNNLILIGGVERAHLLHSVFGLGVLVVVALECWR